MRLEDRVKMGYYPTPLSVVDRIKSFKSVSDNQPITAFETYGIEPDEHKVSVCKV